MDTTDPPNPSEPATVLVAEDEAIVSMQIETELDSAGFDVAGPFATCVEASAYLDDETPDAAVLDLHLRDGPCIDVAAELVDRGVPFIALTASHTRDIPHPFQSAPLIQKPSDLTKLPRAVAGLIKAKTDNAE